MPQPSKDELLVKVNKVALCGTDIAKYKWNEGIGKVYIIIIVQFICKQEGVCIRINNSNFINLSYY